MITVPPNEEILMAFERIAVSLVDPALTLFAVTEVTPAAFRAMGAGALSTFDLIAINNHHRLPIFRT